MMNKLKTRRLRAVMEQQQWIDDHGGNLAGYIERYGETANLDRYGDGGEAIYQADLDALAKAEAAYLRCH